jgi:hypothetical protein
VLVENQTMYKTILTTWSAAILDTFKIHLFTNNVIVSPTDLVSTYTEADFSGYAAAVIGAWTPEQTETDGSLTVVGETITTFSQTASTISNTVYGWWLSDTALTFVYASANFDAPIPFALAGTSVNLLLSLNVGQMSQKLIVTQI